MNEPSPEISDWVNQKAQNLQKLRVYFSLELNTFYTTGESTKELNLKNQISENLNRVLNRSKDAQLIVVSKTFEAEIVEHVLECGHRVFGENKVQESQQKWPALKQAYENVELHLIGPLQSNKAVDAVALFDVIQTVDRVKIASALSKEMKKQNRFPKLLVQVNTGSEPQKAGIEPDRALDFVKQCQTEFDLEIAGLMCIPPNGENPGPHFALLRKLAEAAGLPILSMGMSSDYEIAVELGATHVRVGSAIFGNRDYSA